MPHMHETSDPLAYYLESRKPPVSDEAKSLREILDTLDKPLQRWPIHNTEDRLPISSQKRAIIHERDGNLCRLCGTGGHVLTVDHIIPRSAFAPEHLHVADRSDNLISACWDCNERKSNYEHPQMKRLGVVAACWECLNPAPECPDVDDTEWVDTQPDMPIQVYCGRCGISRAPAIDGWVL